MEIQKVEQQKLSELENLQDAVLMLSDQPHLHAYGERKLNPLNTFENRYTWTTVRTVLEEAQQVGSALVHLQEQRQISDDDFKIGIVGSNTMQESILNLACIMYNITQVYIEDELQNSELSHFINTVDINILFGLTEELDKLLKEEDLKPVQVFSFDHKQNTGEQQQQYENFDVLKVIGQENRSAWKDSQSDTVYGIFFDVKKQFAMVRKTHAQVLNDIQQTQIKLKIEQERQQQGTYISLNGSANYYEHIFRLYNLLHLHNRIALPSKYQNYLTDLYLAQPTVVMANFNANYSKIQKDQQNSQVDFQKQKKNLIKQKDGFVKGLLKNLFYQAPLQQVKYDKVKYVVSINEASYHHVKDLLEESVDISVATFKKALNFLEHDGIYTAEDVNYLDCEGLNQYAKNNEGYLVLKKGQKKVNTIYLGKTKNNQVYLEGSTGDFVKTQENKVINLREIESFYRNNNPHIQDMFISLDKNQSQLIAVVDMHNLVQELALRKDQNGNDYLKQNLMKLLDEYRLKYSFGDETKVIDVFIEQNGFRSKNLLDKFGCKKQERFETFYKSNLEALKSNKQ